MKESVFEVLMYLFDNYLVGDYAGSPDPQVLKHELAQAGFADHKINTAFAWLEGLARHRELARIEGLSENGSMRVFAAHEMARLDTECRGFILSLEQAGVLTPHTRELLIDRVMALALAAGSQKIDLQQLKWLVLIVLPDQAGQELALDWLEDRLQDAMNIGLH